MSVIVNPSSSGGGGPFQPLDGDLTAIAGLSGVGIACRIAANTWALRNVVDAGAGRILVTNPGGVAGNITLDVDEAQLDLGNLGGLIAWTTQIDFTGSSIADLDDHDHGSLTGNADDDHLQYHTDARALAWLGTRSTTDLPEGTNLYFTDERAQDAVGLILVDSATVDFSYNDGGPTITAVVVPGGIDHGALAGLTDDDHLQYVLLAGRAGGQQIFGSSASGGLENLTLTSNQFGDGLIVLGSNNLIVDEASILTHFIGGNYFHTEVYGADLIGFGSASSANLELWANDNVWTATMTGRIRLHSQVTFPDGWTLTNNLAEALIAAEATYTFPVGVNHLWGYHFAPTITYSAQQTLGSTGIRSAPAIVATAAIFDNLTVWCGFESSPAYAPTSTGVSSPILTGMWSRPIVAPSVATTLTEVSAYTSWIGDVFTNHFNSNATIATLAHFSCRNPQVTGTPTITDHVGLLIPTLSTGTNIMSVLSQGTGVHMRHAGRVRIGDSGTTPTDLLEVVNGNAVIIEGLIIAARTLDATTTTVETDEYSFVSQRVILGASKRLAIEGAGRVNIEGSL